MFRYENQKKKLVGDKGEHAKLLYKYKKEMKGALREIRRDRSFIADVKFKEQAAKYVLLCFVFLILLL